MLLARGAAALSRNGFTRAALVTAAVLAGTLGQVPESSAQTADQKAEIVLLYLLKMLPAACKWDNVGDVSKLDPKIAEAEKSLGITADEKTKFMAMAEEEANKPESCDAKGLGRALYDEAVK